MKGPYERLKYDLRRVWECSVCKRRERTAGTVTFRHCQCRMKQVDGQPVVMKLVEDGVQRLGPKLAAPIESKVTAADSSATNLDLAIPDADDDQAQ
jgi:hypothetical protein